MSMGIPVLISKTKGFWDKDKFFDNESILFESTNNPDSCKRLITYLRTPELLNKISNNSSKLVRKNIIWKNLTNILKKNSGL